MDPRLSHALVAILAILATVTVYEVRGSGTDAPVEPTADRADAKRQAARDAGRRVSKDEYRRRAADGAGVDKEELRQMRESVADLPPEERKRALLRYARERRGQQASTEVRQVDVSDDERARLKEELRQRALEKAEEDGR